MQGAGALRHYDIAIDLDGRWHHQGRLIEREALVKLLASVLRLDQEGRYWLKTPAEAGLVEVADVPFLIVEIEIKAGQTRRPEDQEVRLRSNLDEWVTLDAGHPLIWRRPPQPLKTAEPLAYVEVRNGLEARLSRKVYYDLLTMGEEHRGGGASGYGIWSCGVFLPFEVSFDHQEEDAAGAAARDSAGEDPAVRS